MLYPLTFHPIFKTRVWGGRKIEALYGKALPPGQTIGESWEISDRPPESGRTEPDESVIAHGPFAGRSLRWLMDHHGREVLGDAPALNGRFPLLVKILDASDRLSLQVHPPQSMAAELKGDPKTEMWYVTDATPEADLFVGLRRGATRDEFERRLDDGSVAECFHRVPVRATDAMFLPSGRVHAIGGGNVIFEIQQNSDTTYRVFDWNRVGLDGHPRALHVEQSLRCIDFDDFEPQLALQVPNTPPVTMRPLVRHSLFTVTEYRVNAGRVLLDGGALIIVGVVSGTLMARHLETSVTLRPGQFAMLPASLKGVELAADQDVVYLRAQAGGA